MVKESKVRKFVLKFVEELNKDNYEIIDDNLHVNGFYITSSAIYIFKYGVADFRIELTNFESEFMREVYRTAKRKRQIEKEKAAIEEIEKWE